MVRASDAVLVRGNTARVLTDGPSAFAAWIAAIEGANDWIHLENYIIRNDRIGRLFRDLLSDRARDGVQVRVLWLGQLPATSLPALLLSQKHLQQPLRPASLWRLRRREPRTEPPPIPKSRPLAAKARRPARAAGRGAAAAPLRDLGSREGPERTRPSDPVPFPGKRRQ